MIHDYCRGCGRCVARCRQGALRLENGKCVCDQSQVRPVRLLRPGVRGILHQGDIRERGNSGGRGRFL